MNRLITEYIPISECKHGHLYRLDSRNLSMGVYNENDHNGFIGIRTKFGDRFLFTEHHWDGEYYATAKPLEDLGPVPEDIEVRENFPSINKNNGRPVEWVSYGKWIYTDTGEVVPDDEKYNAYLPMNKKLFDYLDGKLGIKL